MADNQSEEEGRWRRIWEWKKQKAKSKQRSLVVLWRTLMIQLDKNSKAVQNNREYCLAHKLIVWESAAGVGSEAYTNEGARK